MAGIKLTTLPVVVITVANTPQAASATAYNVTSLTVQAEDTNTGNLYIGDSNVNSTDGLILPPGGIAEITADTVGRGGTEEFRASEIYLTSATTGNKARIATFSRRV